MKVELKFTLPEDAHDYAIHYNAPKLLSILVDLNRYLRNKIKYEDNDQFQPVLDYLWELLNDEGIDIHSNDLT